MHVRYRDNQETKRRNVIGILQISVRQNPYRYTDCRGFGDVAFF